MFFSTDFQEEILMVGESDKRYKQKDMEKRTFRHTHLQNLTCEIVEPTNKGYKVLQTVVFAGRRKPKTITAYYYDADFKEGGLWKEIKAE